MVLQAQRRRFYSSKQWLYATTSTGIKRKILSAMFHLNDETSPFENDGPTDQKLALIALNVVKTRFSIESM